MTGDGASLILAGNNDTDRAGYGPGKRRRGTVVDGDATLILAGGASPPNSRRPWAPRGKNLVMGGALR